MAVHFPFSLKWPAGTGFRVDCRHDRNNHRLIFWYTHNTLREIIGALPWTEHLSGSAWGCPGALQSDCDLSERAQGYTQVQTIWP